MNFDKLSTKVSAMPDHGPTALKMNLKGFGNRSDSAEEDTSDQSVEKPNQNLANTAALIKSTLDSDYDEEGLVTPRPARVDDYYDKSSRAGSSLGARNRPSEYAVQSQWGMETPREMLRPTKKF